MSRAIGLLFSPIVLSLLIGFGGCRKGPAAQPSLEAIRKARTADTKELDKPNGADLGEAEAIEGPVGSEGEPDDSLADEEIEDDPAGGDEVATGNDPSNDPSSDDGSSETADRNLENVNQASADAAAEAALRKKNEAEAAASAAEARKAAAEASASASTEKRAAEEAAAAIATEKRIAAEAAAAAATEKRTVAEVAAAASRATADTLVLPGGHTVVGGANGQQGASVVVIPIYANGSAAQAQSQAGQQPSSQAGPQLPTASVIPEAPNTANAPDDDLFSWDSPSASDQLAEDRTPTRAGEGSLFVPALTRGELEDEVVVIHRGKEIARGSTGVRIPIKAGTYDLAFGSGQGRRRLKARATVADGQTAIVPVQWSGLRIVVVNSRGSLATVNYSLVRAETGEVIGESGDSERTWTVSSGHYLIRLGGARNVSVHLPARGLARYKLVVDDSDGELLGAELVGPGEVIGRQLIVEDGAVTGSLVLSATGAYSQSREVVAADNFSTLTGGLIVEGSAAFAVGRNQFTGNLFSEQRGLLINPSIGKRMPLLKAQDRLAADILYNYAVGGIIGPFARIAGKTRAFRTNVFTMRDLRVRRNMANGSASIEDVAAGEDFEISRPFAPLRLRETAGLTIRLADGRNAKLQVRGGLGHRQYIFRDTFVEDDQPETPELDYRELEDFDQVGAVGEAQGWFRIAKRAVIKSQLEVFLDKDDRKSPTVEWQNSINFRLLDFASLHYSFDLERVPQIIKRNQIEQSFTIRLGWTLL